MSDKKKKVAAITGVMLYLRARQTVEPDGTSMVPVGKPAANRPGTAAGTSIWGLSGRQAQMQLRTLVQLKTFRKI